MGRVQFGSTHVNHNAQPGPTLPFAALTWMYKLIKLGKLVAFTVVKSLDLCNDFYKRVITWAGAETQNGLGKEM